MKNQTSVMYEFKEEELAKINGIHVLNEVELEQVSGGSIWSCITKAFHQVINFLSGHFGGVNGDPNGSVEVGYTFPYWPGE